MNVLLLSDGAAILGGAEKVALTSAVELARRGNRTTVLAGIGPVDPMAIGVENLEVVCLNQGTTREAKGALAKWEAYRRHVWNEEAAAELGRIVGGWDPAESVIHVHCYQTILSSAAVAAALDSGIPVVATMHDYGIACPVRTFYHARDGGICHRRPMSAACCTTNCTPRSYGSKLGYLYNQWVHNRRARIPDRVRNVIYLSQLSAGVLRPLLHPDAREFFVPNPASIPEEPRVEVARNEGYVFVGRLAPEKDPATFAAAARLAQVPAVFVGDGSERERVLTANPDARVTGWIGAEEVRRELRSARAFVLPSAWYEGAPLSTLEAMGAGLPVLTTSCNASVEAIGEGVTGFSFPPGDVGALAGLLAQLQDDHLADSMGLEAYRRFWSDPPTIERHVDRLEEVYNQIVGA